MAGNDIDVKRTTSGGTSGNTIKPALSINVILDEPVESDDTFELTGGGKAVKLAAKDAAELVDGAKVLRFRGVKSDKQYKLVLHRSGKSSRVVFLDSRYQDLTSVSAAPPTSKSTYLTYSSQVPETLGDKYNVDRPVEPLLVARRSLLLDLKVEDPEL